MINAFQEKLKMQKKMPKEHSFVTTPEGKGEVVSRDFLKETVSVSFTKDETTEKAAKAVPEREKEHPETKRREKRTINRGILKCRP